MEVTRVAIESLKLDPKNARKHSAKNLEAIRKSLKTFGQVKPIVVWRGIVIAGNGTVEAAKLHGMEELEVVRVPDTWDEEMARAYAIADNRTAELAEWDMDVLITFYDTLDDELLESVGFDEDDIQALRDAAIDTEVTDSDFIAAHDDLKEEEGDEAGSLLAIADVSVAEPTHEVSRNDVWTLTMPNGLTHILVCVNPITDWNKFVDYLEDDALLLAFPDPYITATEASRENKFVLVQPDNYLAGHLLDKHTAVWGTDSVNRVHA